VSTPPSVYNHAPYWVPLWASKIPANTKYTNQRSTAFTLEWTLWVSIVDLVEVLVITKDKDIPEDKG
jgi:hypothetical protein